MPRADGIGAMSDARWQSFFTVMADEGLYPKDLDYHKAYTLRFVNRRVGMEQRENRTPRAVCRHGARRSFALDASSKPSATARARWTASISRSAPGAFVSLLGPSGCGKSTLLRIIAGLVPPSAGTRAARREGHAGGIGFVFQEPTLMPWASVWDNVYLPLRLQGAGRQRGGGAHHGAARRGRACRVRARLSARAFRRHADARLDRPRARHRAASPAARRALRRARRDHAVQAQRGSAPAVAGAALHRRSSSPTACSNWCFSRIASSS